MTGKCAYRYKITNSWGSMLSQCKRGSFLLDWTYFGKGHTWTVYDLQTMEPIGGATGVYVDKGYVGRRDDNAYESDAEIAAGAT